MKVLYLSPILVLQLWVPGQENFYKSLRITKSWSWTEMKGWKAPPGITKHTLVLHQVTESLGHSNELGGGLHCHYLWRIYLPHREDRRVKGGCGRNYHPCIFQVLDVALIYIIPPRIQHFILFTIFLDMGSSNGFLLAFATIKSLIPEVRLSI